MNKPHSELGSGIEKALGPAAAISSALAVPWALANTGDLDPGFGDVGRVVSIPGAVGSARSVELLDDGSAIVAGGDLQLECDFYCYWYYYYEYNAFDFVEHITADGAIDPNFDAEQLADTEVFDAIRQPDAKIVAVGRKVSHENFDPHSIVFRLAPNGALDTSFGAGGSVVLASADFGNNEAHAVTIDSSNRIITAGHRDGALLVVRLLADGTLDDSFGSGGAFIGSAFGQGWKVLPAPGGGYRVLIAGQDCRIIGLTDAGALDDAFGTAGVVSVGELPGGGDSCGSLALDATGRLLVSGASSDGGFLIRLLASGVIDGTFASDSIVTETLWSVGPMREAHDGKIVLAGSGIDGAAIMRLQASGELDPLFGNEGRTWIDLPTKGFAATTIEDLNIDANGVVVAAGSRPYRGEPFLIKLIGDAGGDSPGVLGVAPQSYAVAEQDGEAVINVRRTGGSAGQVRIHYYTSTDGDATSDQDFSAVRGVLTWNDGDTDDKQVSVPILADSGPPEEGETFRLLLNSIQGGAGFGTRTAFVDINPDGSPGGQFAVESGREVSESDTLEFYVARNFYVEGAVSVTVTASSGTATAGDDFAATAVTLNWSDQDASAKLVEIQILNDDLEEGSENFTVELSDPTNGAIIGPHASTTFTIRASDAPPPPPPPPPPRRGGAGAADLALLASLGLLAYFRRRPVASKKGGK